MTPLSWARGVLDDMKTMDCAQGDSLGAVSNISAAWRPNSGQEPRSLPSGHGAATGMQIAFPLENIGQPWRGGRCCAGKTPDHYGSEVYEAREIDDPAVIARQLAEHCQFAATVTEPDMFNRKGSDAPTAIWEFPPQPYRSAYEHPYALDPSGIRISGDTTCRDCETPRHWRRSCCFFPE